MFLWQEDFLEVAEAVVLAAAEAADLVLAEAAVQEVPVAVSALEVQEAQAVQEIMEAVTVADIIIITDVQEDLGMFQCLEEQ